MTWTIGSRNVAEPVGATVHGMPMAGGPQIHIDVSLRLVEWPWAERGPISLIPQPGEVIVHTEKCELALGLAIPTSGRVIRPPSHSASETVRFSLFLSTTALSALENARDGGSIKFKVTLAAHVATLMKTSDYPVGIDAAALIESYRFEVPRDDWLAVLRAVGYSETLVTELRLPPEGVDATASSRRRLVQACSARNVGGYGEVMRHCRIALDELKNAGFGGKAPSDVARFLQEKAGTMSPSERLSALQAALQLFLSPAHHANEPGDSYSREDADLSIAMTAALLRLWPMRVGEPPEEG